MSKEVQREQLISKRFRKLGSQNRATDRVREGMRPWRGGQGRENLKMPTDWRLLVQGDTCSIFLGCEE